MADPLSVAASITGVLAFTAKSTREVMAMISEIRDAPDDIEDLRLELQNLTSLIESTHGLATKYPLYPECKPLQDTVTECLDRCRTILEAIRLQLKSFVSRGIGRRSPMRVISWTMRRGEIRSLRDRLRDSKAMLDLSVTVLNSHLTGKGQQEIKDEVSRGFEKLARQFQSLDTARKFQRRLQDDLESVSAFGGRRSSFTDTTDAGAALLMATFLEGTRNGTTLAPPSMDEGPYSNDGITLPASEYVLEDSVPLLQAAQAGNTQQVRALIALGASPSAKSQDGRTALHFCAIYDDVTTAEILVEHGAEIDAKDNKSRSPLRIALGTGSLGVATFLIQRGGTLDNYPALLDAIGSGQDHDAFTPLLDALHVRLDSVGESVLLHEVLERHDDVALHRLFDAGFDPNARDASGVSLIHHAILRLREMSVKLLLQYGADKNDFLTDKTASLLRDDVDWHRPLRDRLEQGITPLATAGRAMRNHSIVRILLEAGADPNWEYPCGIIALHGMCAQEFLAGSKLMIDFGANVNKLDDDGNAPLFWAIICGNTELIRYMMDHGGDLNLRITHGYPNYTPLHLAIHEMQGEVSRILITSGADLDAKDQYGRRPIDLIKVFGDCGVLDLLEERTKR
ncbi:Ankyrin [Coniochaeta hoffmannii]|uniref:Ankyrin n=1 Tax=Coniochaeta hoffmannii TaxID=91930 RepID=A0AA38R6S8_9PEZI|nr:Ankyrin [Coniochaeta hoffmannii]